MVRPVARRSAPEHFQLVVLLPHDEEWIGQALLVVLQRGVGVGIDDSAVGGFGNGLRGGGVDEN